MEKMDVGAHRDDEFIYKITCKILKKKRNDANVWRERVFLTSSDLDHMAENVSYKEFIRQFEEKIGSLEYDNMALKSLLKTKSDSIEHLENEDKQLKALLTAKPEKAMDEVDVEIEKKVERLLEEPRALMLQTMEKTMKMMEQYGHLEAAHKELKEKVETMEGQHTEAKDQTLKMIETLEAEIRTILEMEGGSENDEVDEVEHDSDEDDEDDNGLNESQQHDLYESMGFFDEVEDEESSDEVEEESDDEEGHKKLNDSQQHAADVSEDTPDKVEEEEREVPDEVEGDQENDEVESPPAPQSTAEDPSSSARTRPAPVQQQAQPPPTQPSQPTNPTAPSFPSYFNPWNPFNRAPGLGPTIPTSLPVAPVLLQPLAQHFTQNQMAFHQQRQLLQHQIQQQLQQIQHQAMQQAMQLTMQQAMGAAQPPMSSMTNPAHPPGAPTQNNNGMPGYGQGNTGFPY